MGLFEETAFALEKRPMDKLALALNNPEELLSLL